MQYSILESRTVGTYRGSAKFERKENHRLVLEEGGQAQAGNAELCRVSYRRAGGDSPSSRALDAA